MELWNMDWNFQPQQIIDGFKSVIWTERFSEAGDVVLTIDPTDFNIAQLTPGTMLSLIGSKEIMLLETLSIEDGIMKVTGNTLDHFLKYRVTGGPYSDDVRMGANGLSPITGVPGAIMGRLVQDTCINDIEHTIWNPLFFPSGQTIPNLSIGTLDGSGTSIKFISDYRPLYDVLAEMAASYILGFSLYLDTHSPPTTYSLKFKTWAGVDKSSDVVFSSNDDTLQNIKYLDSIDGHANNVIARLKYGESWKEIWDQVVEISAEGVAATGFGKRFVLYDEGTFNVAQDQWGTGTYAADADTRLHELAKKSLTSTYARKTLIDGELVQSNSVVYGVHYGLGDVVGMQAYGITEKVRVTEYIRSQDETGEKAYPTVVAV